MGEDKACQLAAEQLEAKGELHGHIHEHIEPHFHAHAHEQICQHGYYGQKNAEIAPLHHKSEDASLPGAKHEHLIDAASGVQHILTLRCHSGISGDIFLAGLATLALEQENITPDSQKGDAWLNDLCLNIHADLAGCLNIRPHFVNHIGGWQAQVNLPHSHEHRNLRDIEQIIALSEMSKTAKKYSENCFKLLARCEGEVHGRQPEDIHFHEVGALDSILDICATCEIYCRLGCPKIICSPLPMADGDINCAHGVLPAPAPAVLKMLKGVPVRPFAACPNAGELVTPTGIALLTALNVSYGPWPAFIVENTVIVYGQKKFADVANGAIFALGNKLNE